MIFVCRAQSLLSMDAKLRDLNSHHPCPYSKCVFNKVQSPLSIVYNPTKNTLFNDLLILFFPFCRFKLSQCLKIRSKRDISPRQQLSHPRRAPLSYKESNKILIEILWSARNHGIEQIIVPKKGSY